MIGEEMTFEELKEQAKNLSLTPGVYLMKDREGYVIYVGKSKHLKNRVSSYFGSLKHVKPRIKRMVAAIDTFECKYTDTELDALILECVLIKQYKPLYNRLLKNEKKYRYIHVGIEESLGSVTAVYEKGNTGLYFGPYDQSADLLTAVEALRNYFGLPSCKQGEGVEGCLTYKLKRCVGPCQDSNREEHQKALKSLVLFLEGENQLPLVFYETAMKEASEQLDFNKAIIYRQNWYALKRLGYRQEAIALSLAQTRGMAVLPCPMGGCKLYLLKGTTILQSFYWNIQDRNQLLKNFIEQGNSYLSKPFKKSYDLDKTKIDQSLIIYSYLMNQQVAFYETIEDRRAIEKVSNRLLKAYLSQRE